MSNAWLQAVERLAFSAIRDARIVALMSVEAQSGVSILTRSMCEILARSGMRVLLIDLSSEVNNEEGRADEQVEGSLWHQGRRDAAGFDVLAAAPNYINVFRYNDPAVLRETFLNALSNYEAVVIDLPPFAQRGHRRINPTSAAAACDAVFLLCARNRTSVGQLRDTVSALVAGGANLAGTILNDQGYLTPGAEIARKARKVFAFVPPLGRWLERKALASELLN